MPVNGFGPIVTGGAPAGTGLAQASSNVFQDFTSTLKDLAFFNLTQKKQEEAAARDAALREQLLRMQTEAAAAQNAQDIAGRQALEGTRFGNESKLADQRYARDLELEKIRAANERAIAAIRAKEDKGFRNEEDVRAQLALYIDKDGLKYVPNAKITQAFKTQSLAPLQEEIDKITKAKEYLSLLDEKGRINRKSARELGLSDEEKKALEKALMIQNPIARADAIQQFEGARKSTVASQPTGSGMSFPELPGGMPNIPNLLRKGAGSALALSPVGLMGASQLTPDMAALGGRARTFLGAGALASPLGMLAQQLSPTLGALSPLQMALQSINPQQDLYQANLNQP